MEKVLNTRSRSSVDGLTSLTDTTGNFKVAISFDDMVFNENSNLVELPDPAAQEVELLEERKIKNGNGGIENELLINQEPKIIFEVDVTGDLIVSDDQAFQYFIDNMAELQFEFE